MNTARGTAPFKPGRELYERAKAQAQRLHRPVYIFENSVTEERPPKTAAMVWPNGSVTWGNPQAASRQIDKRHLPPGEQKETSLS